MNEIKERLKSPTPKFFKKLINWAFYIGGIGTGIVTLPKEIIVLPEIVNTIGGYLVAVGIVAASIAKLTVDNSVIKPK